MCEFHSHSALTCTLEKFSISKAFQFLVKSSSFISIHEEPYRCFERLQWLNANENNNIFVQPKLCLVGSIESKMNSLHPISCKTQGHIYSHLYYLETVLFYFKP